MSAAVWSVLALSGRADVSSELMSHLGDTCQTLIFLIGAMTIVGMIDAHGGFSILTGRISTRRGHRLLWIIAVMTFFYVGRAGQHDNDDHNDNGHASSCGVDTRAAVVCERDNHSGQLRRCLVAHRRRYDDHAVDGRQRRCRTVDYAPAAAVRRGARHTRSGCHAAHRSRRRDRRGAYRFEHAACGRDACTEPCGADSRCCRVIVRAGVQEPYGVASIHGHDAVAGRAVGHDGDRVCPQPRARCRAAQSPRVWSGRSTCRRYSSSGYIACGGRVAECRCALPRPQTFSTVPYTMSSR